MSLYKNLAQDFSNTRNHFEQGWVKLTEFNLPNDLKVVDVGCGNGRFAKFLGEKFPYKKVDYLGIDNSEELLQIAKRDNPNTDNFNGEFIQFDMQNDQWSIINDSFDLVCMYAVQHHIVGNENRREIITQLAKLVKPGGYLHISFWQFGEYNRYRKKIGNKPELVGLKEADLEAGDYIMSWERGGTAYRFCHWTRKSEIDSLSTELADSGMEEVTNYRSDGKEGDQNWYYLWKRI